MSGLIIAVPVKITDANIEALSVPEDDYPAWDAASTYALGDYVIVTGVDVHQVWRSVVADNIGHNPLDETDLNNPTYWSLEGNTNAYKMYDQYISTQTVASEAISFTLVGLGQVNCLGFFGMAGDTVTLNISDEDGTFISSETRELVSYATFASEYDWFFTPFLSVDFVVFKDMPPYFNARFEVIVTGVTCKIGAVVPAYGYEFKPITRNSSNTPKDYSIKTELTPGIFQFVKGPSALESQLEFGYDDSQIDLLNRLVKQQMSVPTLVIGSEDYESFVHYGNISECPNGLKYANEGLTTMKIESLF